MIRMNRDANTTNHDISLDSDFQNTESDLFDIID